MTADRIFEDAVSQQEKAIRQMFGEDASVKSVCVGIGNARNIPDIEGICPGQSAIWCGFKVERARVDHLDNVYVSRAR